MSDSALKIEVALRAALIAQRALSLVGDRVSPTMVRIMCADVQDQAANLAAFVDSNARGAAT